MTSDMPSTYVLIEHSEFHDFLHDLEGLHSWARKMVGLGTSITAPAPLGMRPMRPGRNAWAETGLMGLNPFNSPPAPNYYGGLGGLDPTSRPQQPRYNQKSKQPFCNHGHGKRNVGLAELNRFAHGAQPPSLGMSENEYGGCQGRPMERPMWQAPIKGGPHRTPNITRASAVVHTAQRGVRYVRRPRRARPGRDAVNAEASIEDVDDAEDDEYVVEEDEDADVEEREERA